MERINREKIFFVILAGVMIIGVIIGAVYMALSDADDGIYSYLTGFLEGFDKNCFEIFKNSLTDNLKLLFFTAMCGFFKAGVAGVFCGVGIKGFITGFTVSSFIRYYGMRGIMIPLSTVLPNLIFIPALLIFAAYSASFSLQRKNKENMGRFLIICLVFMIVFCIVSFLDGYLTTIFVKLVKSFVVNSGV